MFFFAFGWGKKHDFHKEGGGGGKTYLPEENIDPCRAIIFFNFWSLLPRLTPPQSVDSLFNLREVSFGRHLGRPSVVQQLSSGFLSAASAQ